MQCRQPPVRRPPTVVDDLALLVWGPHQATIAPHCLVGISAALGLHLENHTCRWLHVDSVASNVGPSCTDLP
eukprot:9651990-Prorocentrum_lima.AAC.1